MDCCSSSCRRLLTLFQFSCSGVVFRCSLFIKALSSVLIFLLILFFLFFSSSSILFPLFIVLLPYPPLLPSFIFNFLSLSFATSSVFPTFPLSFSFLFYTFLSSSFSSFLPLSTDRQTGRVLVLVTCLWRTDPGRQFYSCRVNPEV